MKRMALGVLFLMSAASIARADDCRNVFSFQTNPTLSLHDVTYMGEPQTYEKGDEIFEVWQFDYDDLPVRKGMLAVGLIGAGEHGNGINPVGGFVLSKYEAYFDKDASETLNRKNGRLNAVFVTPGPANECGGIQYVVSYGADRKLLVNGKLIEKFSF